MDLNQKQQPPNPAMQPNPAMPQQMPVMPQQMPAMPQQMPAYGYPPVVQYPLTVVQPPQPVIMNQPIQEQHRTVIRCGNAHIALGVIITLLGSINVFLGVGALVTCNAGSIGTGIWSGIICISAGVFSILTGVKKIRGFNITSLVLNIIACVVLYGGIISNSIETSIASADHYCDNFIHRYNLLICVSVFQSFLFFITMAESIMNCVECCSCCSCCVPNDQARTGTVIAATNYQQPTIITGQQLQISGQYTMNQQPPAYPGYLASS